MRENATKKRTTKKYKECNDTQCDEYNRDLNERVTKQLETNPKSTMTDYLTIVKEIGETTIPRNEAKGDRREISEDLRALVIERGTDLTKETREKRIP